MIKKRGSVILESLISVVIIMIIGTLALGISISLSNSKRIRDEFGFYERVSYSVENEIKYNIDYKEIIRRLNLEKGNISLQLNKNYFDFILNNDLLTLNKGQGIIIKKINDSTDILEINDSTEILKLEVSIYSHNNKLIISRKFIKGEL